MANDSAVGTQEHIANVSRAVVASAVALGLLCLPAAHAADATKSPNVELVDRFEFDGATDMTFDSTHAYVAGWDGLRIYSLAAGPRQVGFLPCQGSQNDVAVVGPGVVALGYHTSLCGRGSGGITLIDVAEPSNPKILSTLEHPVSGTHTLSRYPGKPYLYLSPAGVQTTSEGRSEMIIDVSNPRRPKIAATYDPVTTWCHDVTFFSRNRKQFAVCAGGYSHQSQIWDVSDPESPKVVSSIINPLLVHHHQAAISPDGDLMVLADEDLPAPTCHTRIWIYDISQLEEPVVVATWVMPSDRAFGYCSSHNFDFIGDTDLLVGAWYQGGMNVLNLAKPAQPQEVAYYTDDDVNYWSAYWHRGLIFASDMNRGLDVFKAHDLP